MTAARPKAVIAHLTGAQLLGEDGLDRLDAVAEVLDREPLGAWDDPRAGDLLAEAEVVVGHWGCPPLDAAVLDRAPRLGLFAYAAGTLRDIVGDAVFDRGVRVTSGAPANAEPVAEFTLATVLLVCKDALWRREVLRDPLLKGRRQRGDVPVGSWGKTVGIVGASLVGRRVIELLRAFPHVDVVLHDPYVTAEEAAALGVTLLPLDELCARSDILSIHAPELPATRHLIGASQLAALRTGATVINTARGSLVDQGALLAELESGRLYAVLDVTDPERLPAGDPLATLPNVFRTPHLAGSQGTELARLAEHVVEEVRRWAAGEPARYEITRERLPLLA